MTVPNIPYEIFRVETPDHRTGTVEVYEGMWSRSRPC